jgi:hypothetical protein
LEEEGVAGTLVVEVGVILEDRDVVMGTDKAAAAAARTT